MRAVKMGWESRKGKLEQYRPPGNGEVRLAKDSPCRVLKLVTPSMFF